ncbi:SMI1/KNR4 family protein [Tsukamurella paurometabola]|uniref:Knr4/Smi1-like domain-containing protein n=1 Tax=Tsukamurella paurometabola TaxID=2061 RepID=A0A3P8MAE4_TSUPA|nr:SMI1/KNR4 family protein [Tsukamurella paurometabola]MBS4099940.1 hypothetical protein [Tsukamurella paurometabola]UEA81137.1 SMI1/KNR4 family protein [Tsukamurella paurometabola]VDR38110.1 Uncharacterised protein [Tsukamurella paurometabola]
MDVSQLVQLVAPPEAPAPVDWVDVEGRLGTRLPVDYKLLIETYGQGRFFGDLAIVGPDRMAELRSDAIADTVRNHAADGPYRCLARTSPGVDVDAAIGVVADRYLLWGGGIDGGSGFWRVSADEDPDRWPVVYCESAFIDYDPAGLLHYLVALFSGDLESSVFPIGGSRYEGPAFDTR